MANREENLKNINDELELMSDEELEQVAGGTCYEMADDSRFLNSLNGSCDRYGSTKCWSDMWTGSIKAEIKKAWATVGIRVILNEGAASSSVNDYYRMDTGGKITQEEARQHAMEVTQHYMTEKDWKW